MTSHHLSCVRIYDVDDSGSINITEMTSIISTMDELEGEENMQGKDSPAARYRACRGKLFTKIVVFALPSRGYVSYLSIQYMVCKHKAGLLAMQHRKRR
jgi:hypothetical protein